MFKIFIIYITFFLWFNLVKGQCEQDILLYGCVFPLPNNDFISGAGTTRILFAEHVVFAILTGGAFIIGALTIMWGLVFAIWGIAFFWISISLVGHFFTRSFKFFSFFPILIGLLLAFNLWLMVKRFRLRKIKLLTKFEDDEKFRLVEIEIKTSTACGCGGFGDLFRLDELDGILFIYTLIIALIWGFPIGFSADKLDQVYWFVLSAGLFVLLTLITAVIIRTKRGTWVARYLVIAGAIILPIIEITIGLSSSLQVVTSNNLTFIQNNQTFVLTVNDTGTNVAIAALLIILVGGTLIELLAVEIARLMPKGRMGIVARGTGFLRGREGEDEGTALIEDDDDDDFNA